MNSFLKFLLIVFLILNLSSCKKKVAEIDHRRERDEIFNREFSEKMWKSTEEAWGQALGQLMIKISEAYELKMGQDIRVELPEDVDDDPKLDFYA